MEEEVPEKKQKNSAKEKKKKNGTKDNQPDEDEQKDDTDKDLLEDKQKMIRIKIYWKTIKKIQTKMNKIP